MKLKKLARSLALVGIGAQFVGMAWAQGAPEVQKVDRVEITGSSIKRIASEGALPVQVISKEDIQRAGISSAEQLMESLAISGTGLDNMTSQVGIMSTAERGNNGAASAHRRDHGDEVGPEELFTVHRPSVRTPIPMVQRCFLCNIA